MILLVSTAPGLDAFTGGKKVTVKFYVDGEKEAVATFETQLKAVDLSNATIDYTTPYQNYNGNIQRPASNELTVKLSGETVNSENYVVKFENAEEAKDYKVGGYNSLGITFLDNLSVTTTVGTVFSVPL